MQEVLQTALPIVIGVVAGIVLIATLYFIFDYKTTKKMDCVWSDKKRTLFGLPMSCTRYILTEKKLITRKGFLNLQEDECDLYRVIDKKLNLPLGERIFGCGTIVMNVKDKDTPVKTLKSIKDVRTVQNKLNELIEAERTKYRVRGKDMIDYDDCDCADDSDYEE